MCFPHYSMQDYSVRFVRDYYTFYNKKRMYSIKYKEKMNFRRNKRIYEATLNVERLTLILTTLRLQRRGETFKMTVY